MDALNKAISKIGTQSGLAAAIGVAPQVVHNWIVRGRVPADHCPTIEKVTDGSVRCEELRPDVDWGYLRSNVRDAMPIALESGANLHSEGGM